MADQKKKIKALLAQFPLETHSRGIIAVAGMLRDAGIEVVLMGNALSEHIIEAAIQESVDVVGISTYCGGELALGSELLQVAKEKGIKDQVVFLLGGIFPPQDTPKLKEMGFTATFPPSATKEEIVSCIEEAVAGREDLVSALSSGKEYQQALSNMMGEADAEGMDYAEGVGGIQGFHRAREGEDQALRDIGLMGHEGEAAIRFMEEMDALRQKGLGYVVPDRPGGGGGGSQIPAHLMEDIEVEVPNRGNWIATIGSLLGSAGQIFGGYKQNQQNQSLLSKWR